jgi:hypothetical protein
LEEGLTHHDFSQRKLPFSGVFVLEDEEHSVLSGVMQTFGILTVRIDFAPVFGGGTIFVIFTGIFVLHLVGSVVVDIHTTCVGVLSKHVFVHFNDFLEFICELTLVTVKFVKHLLPVDHPILILVSHSEKYWRPLYHKADIDPHVISSISIEHGWIEIQLLFQCFKLSLFELILYFIYLAALVGQSILFQSLLSIKLPLEFLSIIKVLDDPPILLRGIMDRYFASCLIISHIGLLEIPFLLFDKHLQDVHFPLHKIVHPSNVADVVGECAVG